MCGIAGYFNIDNTTFLDRSVLERMIVSMQHRGPDGYGFYSNNRVGLAHARLSIIDLSGGWQPLTNEDKSFWIIFNGEIFNYPELRQDLLKRGHVFSTFSDTEVIVHLFEEKKWRCLEDLNGQFALAIYDVHEKELFLARDRLGIRPLYYTVHKGCFYFGSEIKALFSADPSIPREFNPSTLNNIFTFWTPADHESVFKDIHQIPAGHWMRVNQNGVQSSRQYWEMILQPDEDGTIGEKEYAERMREILIDAVRLRLRADVPVGAYLSGGLDSSCITSIIKNYTGNPLKTFSVSFADEVYDEKNAQLEMVKYLGTDHHEVICRYEDIAEVFPRIIWHTEVPVLRTAPAPLYMLSKLVRNTDIKVVLTGEGADEILGGYDIFKEAKIRAFIHKNLQSAIRPHLLKRLYPYLALSPTKSSDYAQSFFETGASPDDPYYSHRPRWKTTSWTHMFFTDNIHQHLVPPEQSLAYLNLGTQNRDFFLRAQCIETKMLLGNYLLSSQGDRMAMANSIEGRYPFLDHRVVEFAARIPVKLKMKVLAEKNILKKAMADIIPLSIIQRKKQPYMAPDILSFFGSKEPEYIDHYLSPLMLKEAGVFKPRTVAQFLHKCRKEKRQSFRENMAFTGILSTQIIYDRYIQNFSLEKPGRLLNVKITIDDTGQL